MLFWSPGCVLDAENEWQNPPDFLLGVFAAAPRVINRHNLIMEMISDQMKGPKVSRESIIDEEEVRPRALTGARQNLEPEQEEFWIWHRQIPSSGSSRERSERAHADTNITHQDWTGARAGVIDRRQSGGARARQ